MWTGQQLTVPDEDSGKFTTPEDQDFYYASTPVGPPDNPAGYVVAVSRESGLSNLITGLGRGFVLAGIVALLVSLLLGIFIARSIAQPLKQVAQATSAVAAGDYEHRLPEKGPPEIKRVAASFNVMAEQVEAGSLVRLAAMTANQVGLTICSPLHAM